MSVKSPRIAVLLPFAERFTPHKAGAISLFCRDISLLSQYSDQIRFYGREGIVPYEKMAYQGLKPRMKLFLGRNIGLASAFYHAVKDNLPELVEIHNRPQVLFYLKKKLPTVPMTFHFHNDAVLMKETRAPEKRVRLLEQAESVYCVSEYVRTRFLEDLDVSDALKKKCHVVYNGIQRKAKKMPDKENIILYVGRMVEEKGAYEFAQACLDVLPDRRGWKAIMVGAQRHGQEGFQSPFENKVYNIFRQLGEKGEFLGHRPYEQVMRLYERAAIVVVPSKWDEPLGRTAIEALAAGAALISSDKGGLKEINKDCGIALPEITRESLAKALSTLIDSKEERTAIQKKCWKAYNRFELQKITNVLDKYREKILAK